MGPPRERAAGRERAAERSKDKLIVRWLPSKLTEEEFRLSVQKWEESIMWLRFEAGTVPEGAGQRPTPGCAYLQLCSAEVAAEFSAALDGAGYRDSGGMVSRCMVEWAPCQRVPGRVPREDARSPPCAASDARAPYTVAHPEMSSEPPSSAGEAEARAARTGAARSCRDAARRMGAASDSRVAITEGQRARRACRSYDAAASKRWGVILRVHFGYHVQCFGSENTRFQAL